ncbi:DUF559 domain-containing protein [Phytoactinopolyspora mesophila]|uniref:DUF559 domain-containing protein n=1 Tax=Phytoactinopolyspora mesophila TaxID=2650750 RepID=A0A7K3MAR6_9ACTN|nr:DUF559 domain-containing protein [Phytoactinopolyspora mesophila]NDL60270.1 DUF559 domain-containing protein [Phytoactinopolyspora mesophila]
MDVSTGAETYPDCSHTGTPDLALVETARDQFGTFSRHQALECGFTRHQIESRLAKGYWVVVHPKVYRVAAAPPTRASLAVAALLYAGDQAWFSHATAARLQNVDPLIPLDRTWLTVPARVQRTPRPGLVIIRSRRIDGFTGVAHGQPVLKIPRTVVDLAGILDDTAFRRLLYDVLNRDVASIDELLAAAEDFGGKSGIALVRRTVDEFDPAFESGAEYEADELFSGAGLSFERQYEVHDNGILLARLDFADAVIKLGVEIDGARFHSSPGARFYDRERDRMLARLGWHIERFSVDDIRRRPQSSLGHLRAIYQHRLSSVQAAA